MAKLLSEETEDSSYYNDENIRPSNASYDYNESGDDKVAFYVNRKTK